MTRPARPRRGAEGQASGVSRRTVLTGIAGSAFVTATGADAAAPAASVRLPRLPVHRPEPGLVEAEVRARPARVLIDGEPVDVWTYNGCFPGPELRVPAGEHLRLRLVNDLPEPTNLHYHGFHVSPAGRADNIWLHIPPGGSFTYAFDLPKQPGTFWYHPHLHGRIAEQMWRGMLGPLIVEGEPERSAPLAAADDVTLVLRDFAHAEGRPTPHGPLDWIHGKEGELLLCNGERAPNIDARAGLVRLRLLNASNATYLRIARGDGGGLHVIATDGQWLAKPHATGEVLLTPAQRADVLLRMPRDREVPLERLIYDRGAGTTRAGRVATLQPPVSPAARPEIPKRLAPVPVADRRRARVRRRVGMAMFLLNGRGFDPNRIDADARLGDAEIWEIANVGAMDHPFHIHTWHFQPLTINGVAWPLTCWRDTINLTPGDRAELFIPLHDFPGTTVYHCHIVEHGDQGMMATIRVRP